MIMFSKELNSRKVSFCLAVLLLVLSSATLLLRLSNLVSYLFSKYSGHSKSIAAPFVGPSAFASHLYHNEEDVFSSCLPTGIHIAQASNVGAGERLSMTISLFLDYESCGDVIPTILYGQGFFSKGVVQGTEVVHFNYTSSKSDGYFQSPWIWHIQVDDLKAGSQRYWYKIVVQRNRRQVASSDTFYFLTPPLRNQPTTLALVGDLGQTENSTKTMEHIWRATQPSRYNPYPVTQLLIAGDLSYADSDPYRWISWFAIMQPLLQILPLHVAAGNHEIECDNTTRQLFVPYENYFRVPNRMGDADILPIDDDYRKTLWHGECSSPSQFQSHYDFGNSFYSYEHGLAKIIVLSSYSNSTVGSVQYEWLAEELDNFDRAETPWLIVSFHAPFYTTFLGHVDEIEACRMKQAMEPLFLEYGVNFVISGHDHAYMRSHSMYKERVDPTGKSPIYFTLGAAGNREQHSKGYRNETQEDWVAMREISDYGYGHLFLPNATHARFNWVRDGVSDMGISDHVWLVNSHFPDKLVY